MASKREPDLFQATGMPADPQDTRRANRNKILRSLITKGAATRAELARRTGMSRPTVSVIANELLASGVLTEGQRVSSGGAPGTLLEIAKDTGVTIALDVRDLNNLVMATVSVSGEVVTTGQARVGSANAAVAAIVEFAERIEPRAVMGLAVAVPPAGELGAGEEIVADLRERLRLPVLPVDATEALTVAALRDTPEAVTRHATIDCQTATAGLVIDGKLIRGGPAAGSIAHVRTGLATAACPECGQGCLAALLAELRVDDTRGQDAAEALAGILAPLVAGLGLQEVVLAGPPFRSWPDQVAAQLAEHLPASQMPTVRPCLRGDEAVLVGAAATMLFRRMG